MKRLCFDGKSKLQEKKVLLSTNHSLNDFERGRTRGQVQNAEELGMY